MESQVLWPQARRTVPLEGGFTRSTRTPQPIVLAKFKPESIECAPLLCQQPTSPRPPPDTPTQTLASAVADFARSQQHPYRTDPCKRTGDNSLDGRPTTHLRQTFEVVPSGPPPACPARSTSTATMLLRPSSRAMRLEYEHTATPSSRQSSRS